MEKALDFMRKLQFTQIKNKRRPQDEKANFWFVCMVRWQIPSFAPQNTVKGWLDGTGRSSSSLVMRTRHDFSSR